MSNRSKFYIKNCKGLQILLSSKLQKILKQLRADWTKCKDDNLYRPDGILEVRLDHREIMQQEENLVSI